jgi:hypothetical protein
MADRPTPSEEPPLDVRDRLLQLLTHELADTWDAAVAAGGDRERLARIIDDRRHVLEAPPPSGAAPTP